MNFDLDLDTTEKIVSVIAGVIAIGGAVYVKNKRSADVDTGTQALPSTNENNSSSSGNTQNLTVNLNTPTVVPPVPPVAPPSAAHNVVSAPALQPSSASVADLKRTTKILFIDDDRGFKIVGVLKKMGWEHTKLVTDVTSLEQPVLVESDVIFVDIQGVGRSMQYTDEGLGLALAIKRRYPEKKLVIYSAVEEGARFHEAHQEADYNLPKTAEPIRFEDTIVRVLRK